MKKRRFIPQHEFGFTVDTFNLFAESSLDGDRLAREAAEQARAREAADRAQVSLFNLQPQTVHE